MGQFEGKVAIVTGGAHGIGEATARAFASEGAAVVVADNTDDGRSVAEQINQDGNAHFEQVDVSRSEDVQRMVRAAVERFGRLDFLFNNAGIEGEQAVTADCTEANWDRVIGVNLTGVFLGSKYAIPAMLAGGGGAIVNNASVAGLVGFVGIPAYAASKGGIIQLTKTTALEYATQGIRVNCVCPGVIDTPMIDRFTGGDPATRQAMEGLEPVGRLGRPEEIASAVVYLCSDAASFVTGVALPVDGGFVAR